MKHKADNGLVGARRCPRNWKQGVLFIYLWIIKFLTLQLYPLLQSLFFSLTNFSILSDGKWIGIKNYVDLFRKDRYLGKSFLLTVKYALMTAPMKLVFALFITMLSNMEIKGINLFRTVYYLPSIVGGSVAVSILWKFMFMKEGIINNVLSKVGTTAVNWLGMPDTALVTISLLVVWQFGSSMVLFLAGLKNAPQDLYEAASVDGASKVKQFSSITLSMISPIIFFNFMMQTINASQEFTAASVITNDGPNHGTYLMRLKIYEDAFSSLKMGYASAMSWILFLVVLVVTFLLLRTSDAQVFYNDGDAD